MPASLPPKSKLEIVVATLAPYLGENMARASVKGHKGKLGLSDDLPRDELDKLLEALAPGLGVFVGRDRMKEIAEAVRDAVTGSAKGRAP